MCRNYEIHFFFTDFDKKNYTPIELLMNALKKYVKKSEKKTINAFAQIKNS